MRLPSIPHKLLQVLSVSVLILSVFLLLVEDIVLEAVEELLNYFDDPCLGFAQFDMGDLS